jgi:AraC-like DNA-binding protein
MKQYPNYKLLEVFYEAINVPVHLISTQGEILFASPKIPKEADPVVSDTKMLIEFKEALFPNEGGRKSAEPILKISRYSLIYAALPCKNGNSFIVLGPVPTIGLIEIDIPGMIKEHNIKNSEEFTRLINFKINPLSVDQFLSICNLAFYIEWNNFADLNKIRKSSHVMPIDKYNLDHYLFFLIFRSRENDPVKVGLGRESQLLHYIKEGDSRAALRYFKDSIEVIENIDEEQKVIQTQNAFIAIATLIVNSVIQIGFNEEEAWYMWSFYTQEVRKKNSSSFIQLNKLYVLMIQDFCERVAYLKAKYSKPILHCMKAISDHLHEDISLETLSQHVSISTKYLSELFKKETGVSIPYYIQSERIQEAKSLLTFTNQSLVDISNYLNFSSQSYFSKVFKQHCGMTPQEFRNNYGQIIE